MACVLVVFLNEEERAARNERIANFDVQEFGLRAFGMFDGDTESVDLLVEKKVLGAIIDRFGRDVQIFPLSEDQARVSVVVKKSKVFFG